MKIIKSLTIIILFSTLIYAQAIDNGEIRLISQKWASSHNLNSEIVNIICKKVDDEPLLYIVNFEKGWVMVSADESLNPILGFSFDSNYSEENEPDALKSLFESYNFVKNENLASDIKFTPERESIKSDNFRTTYGVAEVEPLIPVTWHQIWPYNAYCPLDDDPDLPASCNGHHNTSCGPTAFAQILRYWRHPVHGTGYHSYWYDRFDCTVEADFQSTYYNWDNMPVSLDFDDPEPVYTDIATLMLHAAVSVDGAWQSGGAIHQYTAAAVKYFDYSPTCEVYYWDDFTSVEWHNIFRNELNNERPIMMAGTHEDGGHYFVCDGYYGDDFYHINWGWGVGSGGYYPLYELSYYSVGNWALIGLEPNYQNKKLLMNDPYSVDDNTVVLLHFDGDLTNQSTLSNNPNSHGTISFADNSELGLGQCLYLDNSNQSNQSYLDIADNNDLDLSGDWTIEMWFKPTSFGNTSSEKFTLLSKPGDSYYYQSNYSIYIDPTSHYLTPKALNCSFYPNEETDDYETTINTDRDFLELGNWYHISYIRKTSCNNIKIVIHNSDRELIHYASRATETTSQPLLNSKPLFIGSNNGGAYFDGYIDELRISNVIREFDIESTGLTLLVPNGGEKWEQNTTQQISWEESNSNNLKIEYTTDNEQSWSEIISSTPASTGFYNWTFPNIDSDRCKIKITDINDVNIYDKSDNVFSILPYELTLNSPNGSNYCVPGTSVLIFWKSTPVSNIKIEYTTNNGNTWTEITASVDASLGIYNWIIPNTLSDQCKVRITDITNPLVFDESDNTFEIGEEIITSIYDIQYTTEPGADGTYPSLIKGEKVITNGIVTATGYLGNEKNFFISSSESGPWKGVNVCFADKGPAIGDEVKMIGKVTEYSGFTEVINPVVTIVSTGNPVSEPIVVKTGNLIAAANAEQYEGCLVKVENVTVTKEPDQYNQIYIDDGTGECQIDDNIFNYSVSLGDQFQYIIGVVDYKYNEYGLLPRFENDFGTAPINDAPVVGNIPNQTINKGSSFSTIQLDNFVNDPDNSDSEITWSYSGNSELIVTIDGSRVAFITTPNADWTGSETITFTATDPDGASDSDVAGFTVTEINDNSIYNIQYTTEPGADGTYPSLMDGENVEVIGIVTAVGYLGYDSNFFISSSESGPWKGVDVYSADKSPAIGDEVKIIGEVTEYSGFTEVINPVVTIVSTGNPVSEPIIVKTGNLIAAANAEQYEGCLVKVENVTVTKEPDQYNQVYINDGTGECQVDDNIFNYSVSLGDQFQYIIGVVDYKNSEYGLLPRFTNDFGATSINDAPVVGNIPDQTINEGSSFASIQLDDFVTDPDNSDSEITWSYSGNSELIVTIDGSRVASITTPNADWTGSETITFTATDPDGMSDSAAAGFTVTEINDNSIYNIQYTTDPGANGTYPSLMDGENVEVKGIVTATGYLGNEKNFFISSSESGSWKGINVYLANTSSAIGDEVNVTGVVEEYYGFTEIISPISSLVSSENPIPEPIVVKTGNLIAAANAEQYEGCLVKVENVTVTKEPDQYNQVYINDGTGECQVDDNIFNYSVSLGDQFQYIIGVVDYKNSEYGLLPRFTNDFGATSINDAPVVGNIPDQTINEGSSFASIQLDDFVTDPDNSDSEITWSYSGNSELIVTIDGSRVASITTPNADWTGSETITFTATDPDGASDSDDATFTVTPVNDPPVVSNIADQTINEGSSFASIQLDDFVADPDNEDSEISWSFSGNDELSVGIDGNRIATILIPDENWFGNETITFTATDPEDASNSNDVIFTVNPVNDPPVISGAPEFIEFVSDTFVTLNIWTFVSDVETSDEFLQYGFSVDSDSILFSYDDGAGILSLSAELEFGGEGDLILTVIDSEEIVKDTIHIIVEKAVITGINEELIIPEEFVLYQNYPNPFNPVTRINYDLSKGGHVKITVWGVQGKMIHTLVDGYRAAGSHSVNFNGSGLTSGIYFYTIETETFSQKKKMILIR